MRNLFQEDPIYVDLRHLDENLAFARSMVKNVSLDQQLDASNRQKMWDLLPVEKKQYMKTFMNKQNPDNLDSTVSSTPQSLPEELNDVKFDKILTKLCIQASYKRMVDSFEYTQNRNSFNHTRLKEFMLQKLHEEEDQNILLVLQDKLLPIDVRKSIFVALEPAQQKSLFAEKDNGIDTQEKIVFLEAATLQLAREKIQLPIVAISVLSAVSLIVLMALVLSGPLGGVLAIGALAVTSVFVHLAATRIAKFIAANAMYYHLQNALQDPSLSSSARDILHAELKKALYESRKSAIEFGFMVIAFAGLLFVPPPVTLAIGGVLFAYAAGSQLDEFAQSINSPYIRYPLKFFSFILKFPVTAPYFILQQAMIGLKKVYASIRGVLHSLFEMKTQDQDRKSYHALDKGLLHSVPPSHTSTRHFINESVGDSIREEFQLEGIHRSFELSVHSASSSHNTPVGPSHSILATTHLTLGVFDLYASASVVLQYFSQQKKQDSLAELTKQLAHDLNEVKDENQDFSNIKVGRLLDMQNSLTHLARKADTALDLDQKMQIWNQYITNYIDAQHNQQPSTEDVTPTYTNDESKIIQWQLIRQLSSMEQELQEIKKKPSVQATDESALVKRIAITNKKLQDIEANLPITHREDPLLVKDNFQEHNANELDQLRDLQNDSADLLSRKRSLTKEMQVRQKSAPVQPDNDPISTRSSSDRF
ncbi:MAG: hypothetical protein VX112_00525 [Pseudomonadota bacterium]|nr:hypothetical protein [Pseudomonadota bacterium]